jgi:hypothetical protein
LNAEIAKIAQKTQKRNSQRVRFDAMTAGSFCLFLVFSFAPFANSSRPLRSKTLLFDPQAAIEFAAENQAKSYIERLNP